MAQKKDDRIEVKLLRRCVVNGEPRAIGSKHKVSKSDAQLLIGAGKATRDLDVKTAPDPDAVKAAEAKKPSAA